MADRLVPLPDPQGSTAPSAPMTPAQRIDPRPRGLVLKGVFAVAYALLIITSIRFVRDDIGLLTNLNIIRVALIVLSCALWIGRSTIDRTLSLTVIAFGLIMSPYLLTDAIITYIDILSLLIFSAFLARSRGSEQFLVYLAYGSLGLVAVISALATVGVLPSTSFEWNGRVKESFGFTNPNTFFFYIFSSTFVFFTYRRVWGLLLGGLFMAFMYLSVGSRTFALAYVFILASYFLTNRINGALVRFGLFTAIVGVVTIGLLTIYFPREFSNWTLSVLGINSDEVFSSRLSLMEFELDYSRLNNAEFWLGGLQNVSDSLYAYFVNGFGLLLASVFLIAVLNRALRLSRIYGSAPLVFVLTFLMIGIVEVPFDGSALMSLLFIYVLFYDQNAFYRWSAGNTVRPSTPTNP
jgi:hypothetical protein